MFDIDRLIKLYHDGLLEEGRIYLYENIKYFVGKLSKNHMYSVLQRKWLIEDFMSEYYLALDWWLQKINYDLSPRQHTMYLYYIWLWVLKDMLLKYMNDSAKCWIKNHNLDVDNNVWEGTISELVDWVDVDEIQALFVRWMIDDVMCKTLTHEEQVVLNMRYLCYEKHSQQTVADKLWCAKWKVAHMERKIIERIKVYLDNTDQWKELLW